MIVFAGCSPGELAVTFRSPASAPLCRMALITGGNSGIGLATAHLFLAEGARVAITGRNQKTLDAAVAELGNGLLAIQADVKDLQATERTVATTVGKFGKLDVVFANAGIPGATPIGQTSLASFEEIIRTNLTAVFFTVQATSAHLNPGASIILNGSVHAVLGIPGYSAYAATKPGVRAMTRNLASEFAPRGIRVNQVTPGGTKAQIWSPQAPTQEAMAALPQSAQPFSEQREFAPCSVVQDDSESTFGLRQTIRTTVLPTFLRTPLWMVALGYSSRSRAPTLPTIERSSLCAGGGCYPFLQRKKVEKGTGTRAWLNSHYA